MKTIFVRIFFLATLIFSIVFSAAAYSSNDPTPQSADDIRKIFASLHWVKGPATAKISSLATLDVPAGFLFLNAEDTTKFMAVNKNISSGNDYLFAPDDLHSFTIFTFNETGYVKDTNDIDANALLTSIRENTKSANEQRKERGWSTMSILGWKSPPQYDQSTKRLEWALDGRDDASGREVINFNTRILGRHGVMSVVLVSDPDILNNEIASLNHNLNGFKFQEGETYSDFREGDKVAEYGLAGLIVGGAAAVAAKTGVFKWLFKFIWVGIIFVIGLIKTFFGKVKRLFSGTKAPGNT